MITTTKYSTTADILNELKVRMSVNYKVNGKVFNLSDLNWKAKLSNKRRAFGTCYITKKEIGLSKFLIENTERSKEEWVNTILHEIAHAIDSEIRGTSSHDYKWNAIARAIGCNGDRTSSSKYKENVKSKYTIKCPNCEISKPSHRIVKRKQACAKCCNELNGGRYSDEFQLIQIKNY